MVSDTPEPTVPMRDRFPSNSQAHKEVEKSGKPKIEAITTAKLRKPSAMKRAKSAIFAADARDVSSYILLDVVLPAAKQLISDIVVGSVERSLYGDSAPRRRGGYNSRVSYTSYGSNSRRGELDRPTESPRRLSDRGRRTFDFGEILLEDRAEGLEVIERLRDILDRYDVATVADVYDLVGVSSKYTDNDWGWNRLEDLRDATVQRVRDGYILILPDPRSLK